MATRAESVLTRRLRLVTPWPEKQERARVARAARVRSATRTDVVLLLVPTAILVAVGLVMVLSASSVSAAVEFGSSFHYFVKQVVFAAIGIALLVVCSRIPHRAWRALSIPLLATAGVLLVLVLHPAFGVTGGG